jgi:hypothetical protein
MGTYVRRLQKKFFKKKDKEKKKKRSLVSHGGSARERDSQETIDLRYFACSECHVDRWQTVHHPNRDGVFSGSGMVAC